MIKAILFDMDGVIADTEPLHFEALKKLLEGHHVHLHDSMFADFYGISEESIWRLCRKKYRITSSFSEFEKGRRILLFDVLANSLVSADGASELLEGLRRHGIRMALVTSSGKEVADFILDKLGVKEFFEAIITSDDVKAKKPDPEPYVLALAKLSLSPQECIAIEDSKYGIESAKGAGIFCIGLKNEKYEKSTDKADFIIDSLEKLKTESLLSTGF